jgi:CRISPR system Cascade subunit CasE
MYLTRIEINLGNGRARSDIGDPYEMHSTLSRALADSGKPDVPPGAFLWRSEAVRPGEAPVILLQSCTEPNWAEVEARSPGWAKSVRTARFDTESFARPGARLRFRLRANPTVTREGKRHALVREEDQLAWIDRQGARLGFKVDVALTEDASRIVTRKRGMGGAPVVVHAVLWNGLLTVTEAAKFEVGLRAGLGHGKFLGLGLLSVAHARA